ncbi:MAG: uridine kinase [Actinomycetota bacterium]|nr:uridine kinase [Actinomycetota bacterium]
MQQSVSTLRQPLRPVTTPERDAVLTSVAERVLAVGPGRLRIGIDGLTAAGKTSFGHQLADRVSRAGRPVARACLDDFKRPWRDRHLYDRESGEGYYRNAYDYTAAISLLLEPSGPLGSGECALCGIDPLTQVDHSSVRTQLAPDTVLDRGRVFAFHPKINRYWDFRIWLEVDPETSVHRGAERDQYWAGSEAETLHRTRYLPAERLYLAEVDPVAFVDVAIDNTVFDRPIVLHH